MTVAGFFAGIGGFEIAFARAGYNAVLLSEIDPAAQRVLKHRFPGATIVGDIRELVSIPHDVKMITAGFPCQNLSMAGDKSGIEGNETGVVSELFKIAEHRHVETVIIENVYFMLHLDRGRAIDWLLHKFEDLKFHWAYRVLDTSGFGIPQRRRRVYLVASRTLDPRTVLFADESKAKKSKPVSIDFPLGFYWTEGRSGLGLTVDGVPPIKGGSKIGIPSAPAVLFSDGHVLVPDVSACERLQGFPTGWTDILANERRSPQWRLLGNAVSVPVAEWVASRLRNPGQIIDFESRRLEGGAKWPDAAFNIGNGRFGVDASDRPIRKRTQSIEKYRNALWPHLSERALNGFLRRAQEGNLRFPEGFLEALHEARARSSRAQLEVATT